MQVDSKYLVTSMRDVFQGVVDFFTTQLTGIVVSGNVRLAFRDERIPETRTYPMVTVYLNGISQNYLQRPGGVSRVVTKDLDKGTGSITPLPIPIALSMQVDTFADKQSDDWSLIFKMSQVLGASESKITTPAGKEIRLSAVSIEDLDAITEEHLWRKCYRFALEVWFPHPAAAEAVYLVLKRRFDANGELFRPDEYPE